MQSNQTLSAIVEEKIERYHNEAQQHTLSKKHSPSVFNKSLARMMRKLADRLEPNPTPLINERTF